MDTLRHWLARHAAREQRIVFLEDALLGNRALPYVLYRLRYFGFRCLTSAVLHGIQITLLRYIFSSKVFVATLLLTGAASFISSAWWGALEVLRRRVRYLAREGHAHRIPEEVGRWLALASWTAGAILAASLSWIAWRVGHDQQPFSVLHFYVLAVTVRLSAEVMTLTLHSGVYALRRVYRPLPAILLVEVAGLLGVLGLWPWLGSWSFPAAVLLSTGIASAVTVHYTLRLYHLLGWLPIPLGRLELRRLFRPAMFTELVAASLSYALMKMDGVLMLVLFHPRVESGAGVSLFLLFACIGPAVRAGFNWAQLLYFDFKRLDVKCVRPLRRRYERLARRLAWGVGFALWGFACLLATVILQRDLGSLYWLLLPFFLSRSVLALAHIEAFSKRRYGALLGSGAVLLIAMLVLRATVVGSYYKLLGLALAAGIVALALRYARSAPLAEPGTRRVVPLTEWLDEIAGVRRPVRVHALRLAPALSHPASRIPSPRAATNRWRQRRLASRIAARIRGRGAASFMYPDRVVWYVTGSGGVEPHTIIAWAGGLIGSLTSTSVAKDGASALGEAKTRGMLGRIDEGAYRTGRTRSTSLVRDAFARMVPRGRLWSPAGYTPQALDRLTSREKKAILAAACRFARHLDPNSRGSRFQVSGFALGGEFELIFLVDRSVSRRVRARWLTYIRSVNIGSAAAGPRQEPRSGALPFAASA